MKINVRLMGVASADFQNEDSKTGSMSAIARYGRQGHDLLYSIVIGDESWVHHFRSYSDLCLPTHCRCTGLLLHLARAR